MTPEQFKRIESIFQAARQLAPDRRAEFLDRQCGQDAGLRAEVEHLLASDSRPHTLIDSGPVLDSDDPASSDPSTSIELPPGRIGRFRIVRTLGEGGMGAVYLAEQDRPRRTVALKVIRPGLASPSMLRRFDLESQVLALLHHPGIAQVYEAGAEPAPGSAPGSPPVPYFVMEYVPEARSITDHAQLKGLGTRQRLELFARVCDAVGHAHAKGIVHRDLKPANILIDVSGQPKIVDFGVARLVDSDIHATTMQTDVGQLVGTLAYMSPEQASGDPARIDARADVYGLGVVLYQLLCGRLPIDVAKAGLPQAVRAIAESDPAPLSSVDRSLRGDIETIVSKAMAKETGRRYQSAGELASDIRRYLAHEPISARPPSTWYQVARFSRRNPALVGAVVALILVLAGAVVATSWLAVLAVRESDRAQAAQLLAGQRLDQARREADTSRAINEFLERLLASADPETSQGRQLTVTDLLLIASGEIQDEFADRPLVRASLHRTIGRTYQGLGDYEKAGHHLAMAREVFQSAAGQESADAIQGSIDLANLLILRDRPEEAEALLRATIDQSNRALGLDSPQTQSASISLAAILKDRGEFDEAVSVLTRVLDRRSAEFGADDERTAGAMYNLGNALISAGRFEQAEQVMRRSREIHEQVLGPNHPDTLATYNGLASALSQQGKLDEAIAILEVAYERSRTIAGAEHPDTLTVRTNLAIAIGDSGRRQEAADMLTEIAEARTRVLGPDRPPTLQGMSSLASQLQNLGEYAEAERVMQEVVDAARARPEEHGFWMVVYLNNLGQQIRLQERNAEAEPLFREAYDLAQRLLPEGHYLRGIVRANLGRTLAATGRVDEGVFEMRVAYELLASTRGPGHKSSQAAAAALADTLERVGRTGEAAQWRARAEGTVSGEPGR